VWSIERAGCRIHAGASRFAGALDPPTAVLRDSGGAAVPGEHRCRAGAGSAAQTMISLPSVVDLLLSPFLQKSSTPIHRPAPLRYDRNRSHA